MSIGSLPTRKEQIPHICSGKPLSSLRRWFVQTKKQQQKNNKTKSKWQKKTKSPHLQRETAELIETLVCSNKQENEKQTMKQKTNNKTKKTKANDKTNKFSHLERKTAELIETLVCSTKQRTKKKYLVRLSSMRLCFVQAKQRKQIHFFIWNWQWQQYQMKMFSGSQDQPSLRKYQTAVDNNNNKVKY